MRERTGAKGLEHYTVSKSLMVKGIGTMRRQLEEEAGSRRNCKGQKTHVVQGTRAGGGGVDQKNKQNKVLRNWKWMRLKKHGRSAQGQMQTCMLHREERLKTRLQTNDHRQRLQKGISRNKESFREWQQARAKGWSEE